MLQFLLVVWAAIYFWENYFSRFWWYKYYLKDPLVLF